jgi:hypothetical protein
VPGWATDGEQASTATKSVQNRRCRRCGGKLKIQRRTPQGTLDQGFSHGLQEIMIPTAGLSDALALAAGFL